jgi:hypothetical protein
VRVSRNALIGFVCLALVHAVVPVAAHPDHDREFLVLRGMLTKVDVANRALELDTTDPRTKRPRNLLLVLDKKVKIRSGKSRLDLTNLAAGQTVICDVEVTHDDADVERLIASNIQLQGPRAPK